MTKAKPFKATVKMLKDNKIKIRVSVPYDLAESVSMCDSYTEQSDLFVISWNVVSN